MLPFFEVSGNPYEMGLQIGALAKKMIRAGVEFYESHWKKLNGAAFGKHLALIEPCFSLTAKLLPKTFEELRGIADGSGVLFKNLFLINSMEMIGVFRSRERCTSILVSSSKSATGSCLIAHNEDWISADGRLVYILRCRPVGEPAFLAFTYGAWIPQYGVNADGLALVADSNTSKDRRVGLSQTLIGRDILRCNTVSQAVRRIRLLPRSDGHSYVFALPTEGMILETTATETATLSLTSRTPIRVHANDYQAKKTATLELQQDRSYSKYRRERVFELLGEKKGLITKDDLIITLSDHERAPKSVCAHKNHQTDEETIAKLIIDPAARTLEVWPHRSCESKAERFTLK